MKFGQVGHAVKSFKKFGLSEPRTLQNEVNRLEGGKSIKKIRLMECTITVKFKNPDGKHTNMPRHTALHTANSLTGFEFHFIRICCVVTFKYSNKTFYWKIFSGL